MTAAGPPGGIPKSQQWPPAAIGALDAPAHGLSRFLIRLKEVRGRDDAKLLALPGAAEGWLAGHRLGVHILGRVGTKYQRGIKPNMAAMIAEN